MLIKAHIVRNSFTCCVHPVGDKLQSDPSGAFSVSQNCSAIMVFPLKMKGGGNDCPAAFPLAIRVIVSLVPLLEWIDWESFHHNKNNNK